MRALLVFVWHMLTPGLVNDSIGLPDVIERIMILFRRHPELICGFNIFLVLVDCRMDYKREPCGGRFITVKTSNESIQFSTEKLRELHDTILAPYYRQPLHLPSSTGTLVGSVSQEVKTGIVGAVAGDRMCKRHNVRSDHENRRKLEDNPLYLEITKRHKDMLERDTVRVFSSPQFRLTINFIPSLGTTYANYLRMLLVYLKDP